jgi:hypothetical protein
MTAVTEHAAGADDGTAALPTAGRSTTTPWRGIVRWALVGTVAVLGFVLVQVHQHGGDNPVSLIQPGLDGPSTRVIAHDFPRLEQPDGLGLDGQQYYAIARDPWHLHGTAKQLDAARYRYQRPLLPWLAWALHPTGGGTGLVLALVAVGLAGVFVGALGAGALATRWRGPPWVAALFPILPGAYWSLRVTVSDALALGLALAALALAARSKHLPAILVGILAVLAKEPVILLFAVWALHRRTRRDALLFVVPAAVVVAWMGVLHLALPADVDRPQDIGAPFVGLVQAWTHQWSHGHELVGMACTIGGLVAGVAALAVRRLRHPLGWAVAIQLAFLAVMGRQPLGNNFGSTRMAMPIMILAAIALLTPRAAEAEASAVRGG